MSRIGNSPITVPSGVNITIDGPRVTVKGPRGELSREVYPRLGIKLEGDVLTVSRPNDDPVTKARHGLTRTLISNMVQGVSQGFEKRLELIGTGYRVQQRGKALEMSLGFSHSVSVQPIGDNTLAADGQNIVVVTGPSNEDVGEQAARIRKLRKPNPYTGKGVKYVGEVIRRKAGKAGTAR